MGGQHPASQILTENTIFKPRTSATEYMIKNEKIHMMLRIRLQIKNNKKGLLTLGHKQNLRNQGILLPLARADI